MKSLDKTPFSKVPKPRPEVESMQPYLAPLEGRRNLLRLDFNENTIGPSPQVLSAIQNISCKEISIYPEYSGLQEAIATNISTSKFKQAIKANQIGLFNGVDAAIHAIFHAYGGRNEQLLTTIPTFGYYNPCAKMQGMKIIEIPYEGDDFEFPFNALKESLIKHSPKLLVICNPNNPTGTNLAAEKIAELATLSPETLVVVDEVYEAFLGDSVIPVVDFSKTPNLIALRSLSKTYGLAGLRIGFAIGYLYLINRIK